MVEIIENEPLVNHLDEFDAIFIGTNCYQVMRNGVQFEIARVLPYVQEANDKTKYGDASKVGTYIECKKENQPLVLLGFISVGYNFKGNDDVFVDYNALIIILKLINIIYKGKKIATTLIGTTKFDGNGDKNSVLKIFSEYATDIDLTVFDYVQESGNKIKHKEFKERIKWKRN